MVYGLVAITVILSLLCLYFIWRCKPDSSWQGIVNILFVLSFAAVIYLYGCWVFLSVYLKYVFAFAAFIALKLGAFIRKNKPPQNHKGAYVHVVFAILFTTLSVLYFTGTTGTPETVNLSFPFKGSRYLVFQGGKGLPTNLFHYSYRGAIYAMDLIKLDALGNRASHIFSTRLEDYHTFGDTIYSPCAGRVTKATTENPDNIPPSRKRGPTNTNHVLIDAGNYYVFLGHMKQYSVLVHDGDSVITGQPLG
jgi:hypothetical protein